MDPVLTSSCVNLSAAEPPAPVSGHLQGREGHLLSHATEQRVGMPCPGGDEHVLNLRDGPGWSLFKPLHQIKLGKQRTRAHTPASPHIFEGEGGACLGRLARARGAFAVIMRCPVAIPSHHRRHTAQECAVPLAAVCTRPLCCLAGYI